MPTLIGRCGGGGGGTFIGARMTLLAGQVIADLASANANFDTSSYAAGVTVNLATAPPQLTVVTAGYYLCLTSISFDPNATGRRLAVIWKNGDFHVGGGSELLSNGTQAITVGAIHTVVTVTTIEHFVAGDYITAGASQNSGGGLNIGNDFQTFLSMAWMGA
jgi:hypothetical protein